MLNETAPAAKESKGTDAGTGHWYLWTPAARSWAPLYKDGGTFTMREARKLKAEGHYPVPSVTTIFKELHKEMLVNWKIEQAVKFAMANPTGPVASPEEYIDWVIDSASNASRGAADLGTGIHDATESAIKNEEWDAEYSVYVEPLMEERRKLNLQTLGPEACVGSLEYGYAGRVDDRCEGKIICDIKSRRWKESQKKAPTYGTDQCQLAAYGYAEFGPSFFEDGMGYIFVASTTTPGRVQAVPFPGAQLRQAFEAFLGLCAVWRFNHSFDPRA
jgi:hypothetical protein